MFFLILKIKLEFKIPKKHIMEQKLTLLPAAASNITLPLTQLIEDGKMQPTTVTSSLCFLIVK